MGLSLLQGRQRGLEWPTQGSMSRAGNLCWVMCLTPTCSPTPLSSVFMGRMGVTCKGLQGLGLGPGPLPPHLGSWLLFPWEKGKREKRWLACPGPTAGLLGHPGPCPCCPPSTTVEDEVVVCVFWVVSSWQCGLPWGMSGGLVRRGSPWPSADPHLSAAPLRPSHKLSPPRSSSSPTARHSNLGTTSLGPISSLL